jgi:hypothetical protein
VAVPELEAPVVELEAVELDIEAVAVALFVSVLIAFLV